MLFKLKDKFGYLAANAIRRFWASSTPPDEPGIGEIFMDLSGDMPRLKRFNGISWEDINSIDISSSDINTLNGSGMYYGTHLQNNPVGNNGGFHIQHLELSDTYKTQIAFYQPTDESTMFHRTMNSGAWTAWKRIWTETSVEKGRVEVPQYPSTVTVTFGQAFSYTPTIAGSVESSRVVSVFNITTTGYEATASDSAVFYNWIAL